MTSIHIVLGMTSNIGWEVEPLCVKTTFLYGDLEEDIYVEKSEGLQLKENIRKCIH